MRIFTHGNVDLDNVASVWAAWRFIPEAADAPVCFVPANWNGHGYGRKDGDLLLDLTSGIKGEMRDGRRHSCFALLMKQYASASDQAALEPLIELVDAADSSGNAYRAIAPNLTLEQARLFNRTSLSATLEALKQSATDDEALRIMSRIFDGYLKRGRSFQRTQQLIMDPRYVQIFTSTHGLKVYLAGPDLHLSSAIFEADPLAAFVIYQANLGKEYGVHRNDQLPHLVIANQIVLDAIKQAGEKLADRDGWFNHPNGFLFCWGTKKAPARRASRVLPEDLVKALIAYLDQNPSPICPTHRLDAWDFLYFKTGVP